MHLLWAQHSAKMTQSQQLKTQQLAVTRLQKVKGRITVKHARANQTGARV